MPGPVAGGPVCTVGLLDLPGVHTKFDRALARGIDRGNITVSLFRTVNRARSAPMTTRPWRSCIHKLLTGIRITTVQPVSVDLCSEAGEALTARSRIETYAHGSNFREVLDRRQPLRDRLPASREPFAWLTRRTALALRVGSPSPVHLPGSAPVAVRPGTSGGSKA